MSLIEDGVASEVFAMGRRLELAALTVIACRFAGGILSLAGIITVNSVMAQPLDTKIPRVPLISQEDAWMLLPPCEVGSGETLPDWALALASGQYL